MPRSAAVDSNAQHHYNMPYIVNVGGWIQISPNEITPKASTQRARRRGRPPMIVLNQMNLLMMDPPNLHDFLLPILMTSTNFVLHTFKRSGFAVPAVSICERKVNSEPK